jgi:hypothetical protein
VLGSLDALPGAVNRAGAIAYVSGRFANGTAMHDAHNGFEDRNDDQLR